MLSPEEVTRDDFLLSEKNEYPACSLKVREWGLHSIPVGDEHGAAP